MKKFLNMEAVQYLRLQLINWDQNFTIWEAFGYISRFNDVWVHTASNEEILEYGGCPISLVAIDQLISKLHHTGKLYILGFHDVWGHTAFNEEILEYEDCPVYMALNIMDS